MKSKIKKCENCKTYTLKDVCPVCGLKTVMIIPPRFSPEDKFGKYRRMLKQSGE